ncbi:Aste57867_11627 [Aphanomyces stellatus]|uniref:Aste57867_11627 protein n=1 Tax=Aphanomyces stellatus TaxID=120398 RepID=A0A485KTS2_9STRA|nr:hypothetical protein As57867_011584 [Aphanomyces stellatus]VFT88485.1 Aste57867_11627 [Aphanomyces stellatus]
MLLLSESDHIKREPKVKDEPLQELTLVERKREQSRASTRRWRANEQLTLEALRHEVAQLEAELKTKLESETSRAPGERRMEVLMTKKRFYLAQNMQLQDALKRRQMNLVHFASLIQRNAQASLFDDAFLAYATKRTQETLRAMNLHHHREARLDRVFNGIHCVTATTGSTMHYDLHKDYVGLNHVVMGDLVWAAYQDKAMYLSLEDRAVDHEKIRTVHANMVVLGIKLWTVTNPNHILQRYLVLHRECTSERYCVTVTFLTECLSPAPHALLYELFTRIEATKTTDMTIKSVMRGSYSMENGSIDEANAALEVNVFAQCRFETYLQAGQLALGCR